MMRPTIGIGVIGFGWMGQAHSRSYLRIPTLFPGPHLRASARRSAPTTSPLAGTRPCSSFGFGEATDDWRQVIDTPPSTS